MNWKQFFAPTKGKAVSTAIILAAIYLGSKVSGFITGFIFPQRLFDEFSTKPITQIMEEHFAEMVILGLQLIAIEIVVTVIFVYLAVSLIIERKLWR